MGGKDHQCLEVEVYDVTKPKITSVKRGKRKFFCYEGDEDAITTDPVKMEQNLRFRLAYTVSNGGSLVVASHVDPNDELILSPDFLKSWMPKNPKMIEAVKLNWALRSSIPQVPTIRPRKVYHEWKQRTYKSKSLYLQKYWKKHERKLFEKAQRREKRKAINMERKAARESAARKAQITNGTVVAKTECGYNVVTLSSVQSLAYNTDINDEILDYGMALAMKRHHGAPDSFCVGVHGFISFFLLDKIHQQKASERYFQKLRKRVPNLLTLKYMVIPAVRESHWFMVIVCQPFPDEATVLDMERKAGGGEKMRPFTKPLYHNWLTGNHRPKILIFDSLLYRPRFPNKEEELESFHRDTAHRVTNGLFLLQKLFWKHTGRAIDLTGGIEDHFQNQVSHWSMKTPGQKNSNDCGLFVITYVMLWFNELKKTNDDYMAIYRKNFQDVFPERGCDNLRYTLYKKIEEWCSSNPELQEEVKKFEVRPFAFKTTRLVNEETEPIV